LSLIAFYCGGYLADIKIPKKCVVLGCLRNKEAIPISENSSISIGDYIILVMALHPHDGSRTQIYSQESLSRLLFTQRLSIRALSKPAILLAVAYSFLTR
jgi:NhaP-type Na+/H+ and K+/H+ antiporter